MSVERTPVTERQPLIGGVYVRVGNIQLSEEGELNFDELDGIRNAAIEKLDKLIDFTNTYKIICDLSGVPKKLNDLAAEEKMKLLKEHLEMMTRGGLYILLLRGPR
jgi:hypothetical protein